MYGQQYDSPWDIMSNSEHDQHTIAFHKDMLGWLPGDRKLVLLPGSVVTTTLERLALPTAEGYLVVQLPIPDGAEDGHFYTLEARRRVGRDQDLPGDAVIIHDVLPPF